MDTGVAIKVSWLDYCREATEINPWLAVAYDSELYERWQARTPVADAMAELATIDKECDDWG